MAGRVTETSQAVDMHTEEDSTLKDNCNSPVNMPDPIRIRSGSDRKRWPEAGRMILAHRLASGPDPFGQNLAQSASTKSGPG